MKKIAYFTIAALFLYSCSNDKDGSQDLGVTESQIADVEKATGQVSSEQFLSPQAKNEYLFAVKMYVRDGKIIADSTKLERVPGKFSQHPRKSDFKIIALGKEGKEVAILFTENIFMTRVCEDGEGYSKIPKGWIEVYFPAKEEITELIFVDESHKESNQKLSLRRLLKGENNTQEQIIE